MNFLTVTVIRIAKDPAVVLAWSQQVLGLHHGRSDPAPTGINLKQNESPEVTAERGDRRRRTAAQEGHMLVPSASLSHSVRARAA